MAPASYSGIRFGLLQRYRRSLSHEERTASTGAAGPRRRLLSATRRAAKRGRR
jgi:hypothetical protein